MRFDLHTHTSVYSMCSAMEPDALLARAHELGLEGIAITEHDMFWPEERFLRLSEKANRLGMLIVNGAEVRACDSVLNACEGDFLVFGVRMDFSRTLSAADLVEAVHRAGGLIYAAHPFRYWLGAGERVYSLELDGIEVFNTNHTPEMEAEALLAASTLKLPAIGGSDAHHPSNVGRFFTEFSRGIATEGEFLEELRRGRLKPGRL